MHIEDIMKILEAGMPKDREALADLGPEHDELLGRALTAITQRESLGSKKPKHSQSRDRDFESFLERMHSTPRVSLEQMLTTSSSQPFTKHTGLIDLVRQTHPDATTDTIAQSINLPADVFRQWVAFTKVANPIFVGRVRRLIAEKFGLREDHVQHALKDMEVGSGAAYAPSKTRRKRRRASTPRTSGFENAAQAMKCLGFTQAHALEWEDIILGRPLLGST